MVTQSPPRSVASAASALLSPATPPGLPRPPAAGFDGGVANPAAGGPPAGDRSGGGTQLVAAAPEAEFRTLAEASDGDPDGESAGLRLSAPLERMPVSLSVSIPVREFRVRSLLALRAGELIETQWANGEDLPLSSGAVQLAWSEFEVVDTRLAVRVTRLA